MDCPKCHHRMITKHFGRRVTLQRCSKCYGLWCQTKDLNELDRVPMLDILDSGDAHLGELYNRILEITCPECDTPMTSRTLTNASRPIPVETCLTCSGVFLDAGELRNVSHDASPQWFSGIRKFIETLR